MLTYAPVTAADVAACIARHARGRGEAAGLDAQKVQNLLFLCQGYSLAAHGSSLFADPLWAAPGGVSCPVAAARQCEADAGGAADEVREAVARVWAEFGGLTPGKLAARVGSLVRWVQEMSGGGPELTKCPEAMERAFSLVLRQGMI